MHLADSIQQHYSGLEYTQAEKASIPLTCTCFRFFNSSLETISPVISSDGDWPWGPWERMRLLRPPWMLHCVQCAKLWRVGFLVNNFVKALTNSEPKYLTITIRRNWSVQASPFRYQCLGCWREEFSKDGMIQPTDARKAVCEADFETFYVTRPISIAGNCQRGPIYASQINAFVKNTSQTLIPKTPEATSP